MRDSVPLVMSTQFDFKSQAQILYKQLEKMIKASNSPGLSHAAIEVALRDAYHHGLQDKMKKPSSAKPAQPFSQSKGFQVKTSLPIQDGDCTHQWDEAFLDGKAVGYQCSRCSLLQKDIKEECHHFYVQSGSQEVCVACRKSRQRAVK
jgi:hypothetical protein